MITKAMGEMTKPNRFRFRAWSPTTREMLVFDLFTARQLLTSEPLDWIQMQSTGLVDKNGDEIFEGDILVEDKYLNKGLESPIYLVEWMTNYYGPGFLASGERFGDFNGPRIIGNIYENPELIKAVGK